MVEKEVSKVVARVFSDIPVFMEGMYVSADLPKRLFRSVHTALREQARLADVLFDARLEVQLSVDDSTMIVSITCRYARRHASIRREGDQMTLNLCFYRTPMGFVGTTICYLFEDAAGLNSQAKRIPIFEDGWTVPLADVDPSLHQASGCDFVEAEYNEVDLRWQRSS